MDWTEDDDEDSGGEDSDDEVLDGKLCTYVQTARVFMTQHWYHCHTCSMVEGVGCCSVCARFVKFVTKFNLNLNENHSGFATETVTLPTASMGASFVTVALRRMAPA